MVKNVPVVPAGNPGSMADSPFGTTWREEYPVIMENCSGCLECALFCPEGAISLHDSGMAIVLELCKGCGICAVECTRKAIVMHPQFTEERGVFPAKGGKG